MALDLAQAGVTMLGGITAGIGSILGDKEVDIPPWIPVDAAAETSAATAEARANLPGIEKLASAINTFQTSELMRGLDSIVPGARAAAAQNITSMLQGVLPESVTSGIMRSSAAKNLGLGVAGSGIGRNLTLRDLGIETLKGQQQGFQNLLGLSQTLQPQMFNTAAWLMTPQQRAELTFKNREMQWQEQLMRAEQEAQPDGLARFLMMAGSTMAGIGASGMMNPKVTQPNFANNALLTPPPQLPPSAPMPGLSPWG